MNYLESYLKMLYVLQIEEDQACSSSMKLVRCSKGACNAGDSPYKGLVKVEYLL